MRYELWSHADAFRVSRLFLLSTTSSPPLLACSSSRPHRVAGFGFVTFKLQAFQEFSNPQLPVQVALWESGCSPVASTSTHHSSAPPTRLDWFSLLAWERRLISVVIRTFITIIFSVEYGYFPLFDTICSCLPNMLFWYTFFLREPQSSYLKD